MLRSPNHRLPVRLRRALTIVVLALCAAFILSLLSGISSALVHQLPHSFNPAALVPTAVTRFFERRTAPAKSVEATPLSPPAPFFAQRTWDGGTSGTGTALNTAANWVGDVLPGTADEALMDNSVVATLPTQLTTTGANLTFGDLIWNTNNGSTITIDTTGSTNRTITLSDGGGSTASTAAGGAADDLLLMGTNATSNTLTFSGNVNTGTARLSLVLSHDGNVDIVNSGATLNSAVVISGNFNLTKTGPGKLTLSGVNTFGSGKTFTLSSGTLNINNAAAVGAGTFAISGGTIDNTTGAAIGPFTNNNA